MPLLAAELRHIRSAGTLGMAVQRRSTLQRIPTHHRDRSLLPSQQKMLLVRPRPQARLLLSLPRWVLVSLLAPSRLRLIWLSHSQPLLRAALALTASTGRLEMEEHPPLTLRRTPTPHPAPSQ